MLITFISRYKGMIFLASMLSMLSALSGIAIIALVNDQLADINAGTQNFEKGLIALLGGMASLAIFGVLSQYLLTRLSASIVEKIRDLLVKRVLSTSYSTLEKMGGHRIYATLTGDVRTISEALSLLPHFAYNLTAVVLCFAYMAYSSWPLFLMIAGILCITLVVAQLIMRNGIKRFKALRECDDELYFSLKALVEGGKELNINTGRKRFFYQHVVTPAIKNISLVDVKAKMFFVYISNWTNVMLFVCMGAVVFGSQWFFPDVTAQVMVRFVLIMIYLVGPLSFLMDSIEEISNGIVADQKIASLNFTEASNVFAVPEPEAVTSLQHWKELSLKQITYQYQLSESSDYQFSLGPIDAHFRRGEVTFISGGNGSGKSTFAKLLTGLYTPLSGTVLFDGQAIDLTTNGDAYRANFSTIFSDFYVFKEVLDANGNLAADAEIERYLDLLKLDDKVRVNQGILSTTNLSHGQKKRLALLLTYLEDKPICLFDEWAADQDPYFRAFFYQELLPQLKQRNKVVIVISHDDRYFHLSDQLYRFESGQAKLVANDFESLRSAALSAEAKLHTG